MFPTRFLADKFAAALPYDAYVATGTPAHRDNWSSFHGRVQLTDPQRALCASFTRRINVLVLSGTWCGDCVQQCPMLDHIARAAPLPPHGVIDLRFLDRDQNLDLAEPLRICAGQRVPVAIFLNEDFDFVSLLGDRTLSRYRAIAARKLGPACPLPGAPVPTEEVAATLKDWLDEFERVHLLLCLSPKLRARHGD